MMSQWIALVDAAEHLRQTADPHDPCAMQRVGLALDALVRYEHILTDAQREHARRTLWLRDKPEPLPAGTSEWQWCRVGAVCSLVAWGGCLRLLRRHQRPSLSRLLSKSHYHCLPVRHPKEMYPHVFRDWHD